MLHVFLTELCLLFAQIIVLGIPGLYAFAEHFLDDVGHMIHSPVSVPLHKVVVGLVLVDILPLVCQSPGELVLVLVSALSVDQFSELGKRSVR